MTPTDCERCEFGGELQKETNTAWRVMINAGRPCGGILPLNSSMLLVAGRSAQNRVPSISVRAVVCSQRQSNTLLKLNQIDDGKL